MRRHPSELGWLLYQSKELRRWRYPRLWWHLRCCRSCREREESLLQERARYDAAPERSLEIESLVRRFATNDRSPEGAVTKRRRTSSWILTAAAAAAICILVLVRPWRITPDLIPKGSDFVTMYVQRGETVSVLGDTCRPGDKLRAYYRSGKKYVLIVGVDTQGVLQTLHPSGGDSSAIISTDSMYTPGSWVVDESPGRERIVTIFSEQPVVLKEAAALVASTSPEYSFRKGVVVIETGCRKVLP